MNLNQTETAVKTQLNESTKSTPSISITMMLCAMPPLIYIIILDFGYEKWHCK